MVSAIHFWHQKLFSSLVGDEKKIVLTKDLKNKNVAMKQYKKRSSTFCCGNSDLSIKTNISDSKKHVFKNLITVYGLLLIKHSKFSTNLSLE